MTALIKSTDGSGWVEARDGDVVKHNGLWCVVRNTSPFTIESADNPLLIGPAKPENCQLIERPFEVWDDIEWFNGDYKIWEKSIVTEYMLYRCKQFPEKIGSVYRHSSPLLRPVGDV